MGGERLPTGVVTFVLSDVVGSTRLWERAPSATEAALARHDEIVARAMAAGGGVVVKARGEGDSTFSVFARASDALRAAYVVQRELLGEQWPADAPLKVRLALHTGEAVERDGDFFGPAVNRTARLRAMAEGGEILVSGATAELVADHLPPDARLVQIGALRLRDLTRPEPVFVLVAPGLPAPRTSLARQAVTDTRAGAVLEAQGKASHLEGDYAAAMEAYECAYAAYRQDGDLLAGARAARTVGWFRGWIFGDWAVSRGWAGRARRMLEQAGADRHEHGWILFEAARAGNDLEEQRRLYLAAIELARQCGDSDLECEATASLGMMLVFSGFVAEGMVHLDEALAAVCAGEVDELPVVEGCLCGLFNACERTHDVGRAEEWLRAADDVIQRRQLVAVAGYCRAHYGGILIAAGRWAEAESELTTAARMLPEGLAVRANALCRLADLRIRQGRLEEAAQLLAGLEHHEDAIRPLAALHLARGEAELALDLLERVLSSSAFEDYVEIPLLALLVDTHIALGGLEEARRAERRLTELARNQSSSYLKAVAAVVRGQLCRASGDGDQRACLHQALSLLADAKMPVELARCRLELARALAEERPPVAIAEATAALAAFELVGATPDADAAAALLRSLGAPARTGPKGRAGLTKREDEVFALLGHGLTNAEIGERLYISPKTVESHVSRILAKLGVRSRAEAAVHALRASQISR